MTPARNKSEQELHNEKLSSVNFGISYILGDSFGKMASSEVSSPLSNKSFQDIEAISGTDGNSPQPPSTFNDASTGQETNINIENTAPPTTSNTFRNSIAEKNSRNQKKPESKSISWLHRPCLWVAEGIKWFPVAFISAVIGWSYYAFVVVVCVQTVESLAEKIVFLIFYHFILALFVWSYLKTIFAPKCETPSKWKLSPAMVERLGKAHSEEEWKNLLELYVVEMEVSVMQRSIQGAIRYCEKCQAVKPDRSHHCSVCGSCILKMDHHCPWVNNCVAFNNYKFFMLFLGYALVYTVYLALCNFKYFILFWTDGLKGSGAGAGKFHVLFLFFVSVMFCISVSSLFWYHVYLVLSNRSTLEQFRAPYFATGPDENGWGLGKRNNFQEVFGDRPLLWFFPVQTTIGDGLTFPTRINTTNIEANYQSTSSRPPLAEAMASPAAKAVRGRSKDIDYIDEDPSQLNGVKHTEIVMDSDERVQVKVSKLPKKHDLMQLQ